MSDFNPNQNYSGPTTTNNSVSEGRMKVAVGPIKKRKRKDIIKKYLKTKTWQE